VALGHRQLRHDGAQAGQGRHHHQGQDGAGALVLVLRPAVDLPTVCMPHHPTGQRHIEPGARAILALVVVSALASLGAIVAELAVAKGHGGVDKLAHIGLAVLTLMASWAFAQMSFALHYAHDYYLARSQGQPGGLTFPDTDEPDYVDFLYFSAVIGTSGQTADVSFSSPHMRRIGLLHCVLSFVFNTSLIGLMINVGSSLL
jgi:uncharacterized membrane protein